MFNPVFEFLKKHSSLVLTTHHPADADGIGAEKVFALVAASMGKQVRVVNSGPVPEGFRFMDTEGVIEVWAEISKSIPPGSAMVILDTTDEYNIGELRDLIPLAGEVFVIDHHEPNQFCTFGGYIDNGASSTCELVVELAQEAGVKLSRECAQAAYTGLVYDTGFFAYSKTTARTFRTALTLVEAGADPYFVYRELNENGSTGSVLLQKAVLSTLEIHNNGRVAAQILRKEDLEKTGARFEEAENFINVPLKSRNIEVSILVKESKEGHIRCSLRSKGGVNVSKIAQALGGGGHVAAAGFKSSLNIEETLANVLSIISGELDGQ